MAIPHNVARGMYWLGVLLMLFALADSLLYWAYRINLTGVQWSPLAAGGVGIVLMNVARFASQREARDD